MNKVPAVILVVLCMWLQVRAQNSIPVGSWRLHLSYHSILAVEPAADKIFAASVGGVLAYDRITRTLTDYNKLSGLSSTGITCIRYAPAQNLLLVGYADGELDIIGASTVFNFDRLADAAVTASRKINDIAIHDNFAYLSTAYGVVVFDLQKLEIKETWRDLGPAGSELFIYATSFLRDSVYLATRNGVLAGDLHDNLLDFASWERFSTGDLSGAVRCITQFSEKMYIAGPSGVLHLADSSWVKDQFLQYTSITSLTASDENLFVVTDSAVRAMDRMGEVVEVADPLITAPVMVGQDQDGNLWIGDRRSGLLSNSGGHFSPFIPNGPSLPVAAKMLGYKGKLYAVSGGFTVSGEAPGLPDIIDIFDNGAWTSEAKAFSDITDVAFFNGDRYVSSLLNGVEKQNANGTVTMLDQTNSPLKNVNPSQSTVTALASSADGLWVANSGGTQPLHLFKADGTWQSFAFGFPNEQRPIALTIDGSGGVWMALDPATGGGLIAYNPATAKAYLKTNVEGTGALPNMNVRSLATDKDGYTWVGTDTGIAYFYSMSEDAIKPIYESRFLLRDEKITAIAVDGGNRKWIGTQQGAWLFSPTGESLIHHFTADNSPLLSDKINDIEINGETGEVFFATDRGIASYRSDAVDGGATFSALRIFPNPVPPGYSGTVGITGLAENAIVKITDIRGNLVWQTRANGGMATWNARSADGRPAATGVYLVFASSEDGTESVVGKIAVIQ